MEAGEALDTLLRTEYARRKTRAALRSAWFPPFVFGILLLLSLSVAGIAGFTPVAVYWLLAGPAGLAAVLLYYLRRRAATGVGGRILSEVVAGSFLFVTVSLLSGLGGLIHTIRFWYLYQPNVGWGVPVLGIVYIPPLAAPLAILLGYVVFAWMEHNPRLAAVGLGLSVAVFVVGGMTLTLAHKALLEACVPVGPGLESCSLSRLGSIVAFRVAPTVGYAAALLVTAALFRRAQRSPL